jgi:hypothetical protein
MVPSSSRVRMQAMIPAFSVIFFFNVSDIMKKGLIIGIVAYEGSTSVDSPSLKEICGSNFK